MSRGTVTFTHPPMPQPEQQAIATARFYAIINSPAEVAELADAHDSKSCGLCPCGFDSRLRHHR